MKLNVLHVMNIVKHAHLLYVLNVIQDIIQTELIVLHVKRIVCLVLNWYVIHVYHHIKFIKIHVYFVKLDVKFVH